MARGTGTVYALAMALVAAAAAAAALPAPGSEELRVSAAAGRNAGEPSMSGTGTGTGTGNETLAPVLSVTVTTPGERYVTVGQESRGAGGGYVRFAIEEPPGTTGCGPGGCVVSVVHAGSRAEASPYSFWAEPALKAYVYHPPSPLLDGW